MKLPGQVRAGVPSLGRYDINAPMRTAIAKAGVAAEITRTVDYIANDIHEREVKFDRGNADANLRGKMAEFAGEYEGQEEISVRDPRLKKIKYEKREADGSLRQTVPKHEVYSQMYEAEARKQLDISTKMIRNAPARQAWGLEYAPRVEENVAKAKISGMNEHRDYMKREQEKTLGTQFAMGQYEVMREFINSENYMGSDATQDYWRTKIDLGEQADQVARIENIGTPNQILAVAANLEGGDYKGPWSVKKRHNEAARLRKYAKAKTEVNSTNIAHGQANRLWNSGLSLEEQLEKASQIPDGKVAKATREIIRGRASDQKLVKQMAGEEAYESHSAAIREGGMEALADVTADERMAMTDGQYSSLVKQAKGGDHSVKDLQQESVDYDFYMRTGWSQDAGVTKKFVDDFDPSSVGNWENQTKAKEIVSRWKSLRTAKRSGAAPEGSTRTQIVNGTINQLGWKKKPEESNDLRARFDQEISDYYDANGKNPDSVWMQNRMDALVMEVDSGWFGGGDRVIELETDAGTETDEVVQFLISRGVDADDITVDMINEAWAAQ